MTQEERYKTSIKILSALRDDVAKHPDVGESVFNADRYFALTDALEALEKQIPRKIIYNTIVNEYTLDSRIFFYCPNCKRALAFTGLDYCWKCGQALDWSYIDRRHTPESEVEE